MINFKTFIKNIKSKKVVIIIILICLVIFLYFVLRKKPIEKFSQDLCIRDEVEINRFKQSFYGGTQDIIDKLYQEGVVDGLKNNSIEIKVNEGTEQSFSIYFKNYSIIKINDIIQNEGKNNSLITPTGILFDPVNDDIIVFDIYKLRRFQYRLNRTNFTRFSQDEYTYIEREIFSQNETKRLKLFIQLYIYCYSDPRNIYTKQLKN